MLKMLALYLVHYYLLPKSARKREIERIKNARSDWVNTRLDRS